MAQLLIVSNLGAAGLTPAQAFLAGVVPFVGIDAVKAAVAVVVAEALRRTGVVPVSRYRKAAPAVEPPASI